jgi:transposase-like protein
MGLRCPNVQCAGSGSNRTGSVIRYGFYKTKWGKGRRYRCQTCGKTCCSNSGTPYHRLQNRHTTFNEVATLSVEGLNKSAIARVKRIAWNTVDRWLQKAAYSCRRFNDHKIEGIVSQSFGQMRFARSSMTRNSRFGSLLRLRSGLVFGLQPFLEDEAIETHSPSFEISPVDRIWNVFL